MANEVEIRVTAKDVGAAKTFEKVRRDARTAGTRAGDEFAGSFSGTLDQGTAKIGQRLGKKIADDTAKAARAQKPIELPATADNPIDAAWRAKVEASLKATAKQALEIPVSPESETFRREMGRLMEQATRSARAEIPVDVAEAAEFKRQVEALAAILSDEVTVRVPVEVDNQSLAKVAGDVEKATEQVAKRANAQFKAMQFGLMFAGLPVAAAGAAGLAVGALAAVPLAFTQIALAGQQSNLQVTQAWSKTGDQLEEQLRGWSEPFADDFVKSAEMVRGRAAQLSPQIAQIFENSDDYLLPFTNSLLNATQNAIPGFVVASQRAGEPMAALGYLAEQTGSGLTAFFVNASEGADGAAADLRVLGDIGRDALGFLGTVAANLADNGTPALYQFSDALNVAEDMMVAATAAGSPLYSFTSGFISTVSGGLGILQGFVGLIGMLPAPLGEAAGQLYAASKMANLFGINIKDAWKGAEGGAGRFQTIAGRTVLVLGLIGAAAQVMASNVERGQTTVEGLSDSLDDWIAKGKASGDLAKLFGSNLKDLSDAFTILKNDQDGWVEGFTDFTGNLIGVDSRLDDAKNRVQQLDAALASMVQNGQAEQAGAALQAASEQTGRSIEELTGFLPQYKAALDAGAAAAANAGTAAGQLSYSQKLARQATADLSTAFQGLGDATADVTTKGKLLQQVLDTLTGRTPSFEEATQSINDALRGLGDNFKTSEDRANGFGSALLNADGTVNTATRNGSALQDTLETLQGGFANASVAIDDLVKGGMSYDAAAKQVNDTLAVQRQRFIDQHAVMGLTRQQAEALANQYGLFPTNVATMFTQPGMPGAQQAADLLRGKVLAVPNQWTTITTALTADAVAKLEALGFQVRNLPNGDVEVIALTASAEAKIGQLVKTRSMNIEVNYVTGYAGVSTGMKQGPRAIGGVDIPGAVPMAEGGVIEQIPHIATVVPPNMPRLIGDNMRVPEAFIPLDPSSQRSQSILAYANQAMGNPTGDARGMADGGLIAAAQEVYNHWRNGGQVFEDFSFYGNSANVRAYNDELAAMYHGGDLDAFFTGVIGSAARAGGGVTPVRRASPGNRPARTSSTGPTIVTFDTSGAPPLIQALIAELQKYVHVNGGNVQTAIMGAR
ncbi:hypothetical protein [Amycolatopsis sp. NPDC006125]|uniref:hypothetical protein n=1 Tax=Amycolatopsis sp. NPDC006125 TaxID=3156730 RepID=UPI0033AB16C2